MVLNYILCLVNILYLDWNCSAMSQGQHFMTDLLVSSLMADGGLEISLQAAIKGIVIFNALYFVIFFIMYNCF